MPINFNGVVYEDGDIDALEAAMDGEGLSDLQKKFIRNDFYGFKRVTEVTPRQFRLAVVEFGIPLSSIEQALNGMPEPIKTQALVTWEYSTVFYRDNPMFQLAGVLLGISDQQLDDIFTLAAAL